MHDTIATYNKAAKAYAEKFNGIPSREDDVYQALNLWGREPAPAVVEWGCGNGRDAEVILKMADTYVGIDASEEMIMLARHQVPHARFEIADVSTYVLPVGTDIVFAFASLLHCSTETFEDILRRAHTQLSDGGLIYISLKRGVYEERIITDDYGPRTFYFYDEDAIHNMIEGLYEMVHYNAHVHNTVDWLTCALKKI